MLKVWLGIYENRNCYPDDYFNNVYDESWFDDELVKEMVLDVDKSVVLSRECIQSPVLGQIPPTALSGGVKALICLLKDDPEDLPVFDLLVCGQNCVKWLLKIGEMRDVLVSCNAYHIVLKEFDFKLMCMNDGSLITDNDTWRSKLAKYVG